MWQRGRSPRTSTAKTFRKGRSTMLADAREVAKHAPVGRVRRDPQSGDVVRPDHERDAAGGARSRCRRGRRTRRGDQRDRKDERADAGPSAPQDTVRGALERMSLLDDHRWMLFSPSAFAHLRSKLSTLTAYELAPL